MNTLLSGNDSAPGAVFWTLVKLWRPLQLMPGLQNGKSNGTASAARQPSGRREASPQTNASPLVTTNLGLSGRLLTDYGRVIRGPTLVSSSSNWARSSLKYRWNLSPSSRSSCTSL
ncbi:hypothetical protein AAFF_G00411760 [Aldrovandia affinis]|uniref:Uncharacterized protein n=1 Tax=Aldrovandia affinis TaxID=143900 RepID=A0AAD7WKK6_9TELE|nr:hypothetical protein AAFF_G00411760 [Aldrovandia affinis]